MGITGKDIKMDLSNNVKNGIVPTETNKSGISSNLEIGNQIVPFPPFSKTEQPFKRAAFVREISYTTVLRCYVSKF